MAIKLKCFRLHHEIDETDAQVESYNENAVNAWLTSNNISHTQILFTNVIINNQDNLCKNEGCYMHVVFLWYKT